MHRNLHWLAENGLASWLWAPDDGGGSGGGQGGGDPKDDEEDDDEEDDEEDPPRKPKDRTFTQKEVNRIMAREKKDGKSSGVREVLEALGVKDLEEAKSIIKTYRDDSDAKKDETTKAAEAAKRDREAAEEAKREALLERVDARIERQLMKAKVKEGKESKVAKLLDIDREKDPSADDIKEAIEEIMEDFPELFTSSDEDDDEGDRKPKGGPNRPTRVNGDPGRPPRKVAKKDPAGKARSRLEERHGRKLQSRSQ